jgi:hypothetical protein
LGLIDGHECDRTFRRFEAEPKLLLEEVVAAPLRDTRTKLDC